MLKNKKSKVQRLRGTSSHGWGHKKKHRGKGHKGGVGLAGTGARGDSKKSALLSGAVSLKKIISAQRGIKLSKIKTGNSYFGKKGFTSVSKKKLNTISLAFIEENFDKMVEQGKIVKEKTEHVFDATFHKIDKVLGKGQFTKKLTIICKDISNSAKQRIEDVGGKVKGLVEKEESTKKE